MGLKLPYELTEGTVAFARQVMANFRALLRGVDNSVEKGSSGNSSDIVFDDGENLQDKLDNGGFNDWDGNLYDGYASFFVNSQGHLIVTLATGNGYNPYEVDENGHLILTVGDPETSGITPVTFDLGSVVGPSGPQGNPSATVSAVVYANAWDSKENVIICDIPTGESLNNFIVQPDLAAVEEAYEDDNTNPTVDDVMEAWAKAMIYVKSQTDDQFTIKARGSITDIMDIPISVVYGI